MKAIGAMTAIVDLELLHKPVLRELLTDTVPFLVHPVGGFVMNVNFIIVVCFDAFTLFIRQQEEHMISTNSAEICISP